MKQTTKVTVKQVTLRSPSHVCSASKSEHKLEVLRRFYKQDSINPRLIANPVRLLRLLQGYADKAAWHHGNIAAWNRATVSQVMEYPIAT